jgi:hypothetical protein
MAQGDSYTDQLKIENQNLVNEISKLENESNKYGRVNEYYVQDEVMLVYIQKMMTVLYAVIYFGFIYMIVISDRHIALKVLLAALFATLPFIVHIVTAYLYSTYLQMIERLKFGTVTRVD